MCGLRVGQVMDRDLPKDARCKPDLGRIGGSGVKTLHRLEERSLLFHSREKLELQREFHRESITALLLIIEGKVCALRRTGIPPRPERQGFQHGGLR